MEANSQTQLCTITLNNTYYCTCHAVLASYSSHLVIVRSHSDISNLIKSNFRYDDRDDKILGIPQFITAAATSFFLIAEFKFVP